MIVNDLNPTAPNPVHRPPRWRELMRTRWVRVLLMVEILVALAVAAGLWTLRQQTLDSDLRNLASLSAAMAAQADGTLDVAAAALSATRDELSRGQLPSGLESTDAVLRARAATLPRFWSLTLFAPDGRSVSASRDAAPPADTAEARDFFVAARQAATGNPASPGASLFVGSPYTSPADGRQTMAVSLPWLDGAGAFRGVVALSADPEFLDGGFERFRPSDDTSMAIYRHDRQLVSDGPGDGSDRLLPANVMARLWADPGAERPRLITLPDGRDRLVAAHHLQRYPLMVVVSRDAGVALADWNELAWLVGAFAGSALLVTLILSLYNAREQTLRMASEAALAAEQVRAMRAFQAAQEGHWEWNPLTGVTHLSARMRQLLNLDGDLPRGVNATEALWSGTVHPDDLPALRAAFEAHQHGRAPAFDFTFRVLQADGSWRHVRTRGHAWRNEAGAVQLFSGTAVDVTEEIAGREQRRQLEEQLERSRKLEALGTLAGGVAHDFNNILASVIGYSELARNAAPEGSGQARQIDQVLQAGQRGKSLVERILSFSHGRSRAHAVFRLQPVVEEVLQMLAASLPAGVSLDPMLQAPGACVAGDSTLVYEAVMNLCTNGMHAMQASAGDRKLQVTLQVEEVSETRVLFDTSLKPGSYVRLAVSDTGSGIAPEVMSRLFEPFFTTKGPQQGTGLGLAVVHGAMSDVGGAIDVRSTPGEGSCFTLYFPRARENADDMPLHAAHIPLGNGQAVLVVDDEAALVELAEELLAGLGYEPYGVPSSRQALERFRQEPERFDLVLTDEVMPDMTGTALATELHRLRPELPIVLASGYGGPQLEQRAAAAGVTVLVKKPLSRAELAQALAQALGSR